METLGDIILLIEPIGTDQCVMSLLVLSAVKDSSDPRMSLGSGTVWPAQRWEVSWGSAHRGALHLQAGWNVALAVPGRTDKLLLGIYKMRRFCQSEWIFSSFGSVTEL